MSYFVILLVLLKINLIHLNLFIKWLINFWPNIRNFKKLLTCFLCDNVWLENFFFYHKTCFQRKARVLFILNAIFKDRALFTQIQWNTEIDVIVQKVLNFVEKYVRLKWKKKKVNVIIGTIIEYTWMCLNVPI